MNEFLKWTTCLAAFVWAINAASRESWGEVFIAVGIIFITNGKDEEDA